jgi:hypothetical protein
VDTAYAPPRILAAPADPSHVAYASRREIHVSADGGLSFQLAARPDTVYLDTPASVQVSHDGGATFTPVNTPYEAEKQGANRLWTDRNRPGRLYAMPAAGGLFAGDLE